MSGHFSDFRARREKRIKDTYNALKVLHPTIFQECLALGVVLNDMAQNGADPLNIAAKAEESAVMLAASALGLKP